jgi:peptide/nickel transport system substrate-binding protein
MTSKWRAAGAFVAAAAVSVSLAACGGSSSNDTTSSAAAGKAGGTLYYLTKRSAEHLDPQRMYIGRDLANMGRIAYRSLVQFPVTEDESKSLIPVPDLATDLGTSTEGGKVWSFTLKDGVKWQDGKPVACADLKYGLSRSFATDVITGGPNYILGYLDVPQKDGAAAYNGPYKKVGQADFDKAVTCEGNTITYRFNKPWADFPLAVASLRSFDPYREDQDKGDASNFSVFSNGPYMLKGTWKSGSGGTYVRNPNYDAATDGQRKALPDEIVFQEGLTEEIIYQRLIADNGDDKFMVTDRNIPPSMYGQITGSVADRSANPVSPFVDYLLPNFVSPRMKDAKVRQALMMGTDRAAYVAANGGEKSAVVAQSLIHPSTVGYVANPTFAAIPDAGDPEGAKKLLQEAGVKIPYPITYTYSGGTPKADNTAAALKAGWDKAGFSVTLDSLPDTYYDVVNKPNNTKSDVMWGGWGADWPGVSTVLPPLFDSRLNLSSASVGQDYGSFKSDAGPGRDHGTRGRGR